MVEFSPEFLKRLKKINQRRMRLVQDLQTNYSRDLESIAHTIQTEIEALYGEFDMDILGTESKMKCQEDNGG